VDVRRCIGRRAGYARRRRRRTPLVVGQRVSSGPTTANESQFNIQIPAKDYYSFFTMTLGAMGLIFQLPIGILAVSRLGIVTPKQLAQNRRYAYLVIAVVAMVLPGTDPISMLLEMAPLIVLFEASLVLARLVGTPAQANPHTDIANAESAL
jgi:Sec-independent protein secretion pathway component TatC